MITETEKSLYKKLCSVFGSLLEFTQGGGGNISVKTESQLLLKSSGTFLSETSLENGYVVCDRRLLETFLENGNEYTKPCVVEGQGQPSMEGFFHLLPYRIVVHFHPCSLLPFMTCSSSFPDNSLLIPYIKPGIELAKTIQTMRKEETLLFLESHGIIVMGETEKEIYDQVHKAYSFFQVPYYHTLGYSFFEGASKVFDHLPSHFLLEIHNTHAFYDPIFMPYTPDIFLFLKTYPLHIEKNEEMYTKLVEYNEKHSTLPSIVTIKGHIFAFGESWKKCIGIAQIFQEYQNLARSPYANTLPLLSDADCLALTNNVQEKYRLSI